MRGTSVALSLLFPLWLGVAVLAGPAGAADLSFLWSEASSTPPIGTTTAAAGSCDGIGDGIWNGCRGTGCHVCQEKLNGYDCYFQNHPDCVLNTTCAGQFYSCDAACPAPTEADRCANQCDGIGDGIWNGCRGTGCHVCQEKLAGYDCYFLNHPGCQLNTTCSGLFFSCDRACPPPTEADRCQPNCYDYSYDQWACWGAGCNYSPGYCNGFQDQEGNSCWNYWNEWDCNFAFGSCWWTQGTCYP